MNGTNDRMIVVSTDSHAGVPHDLWAEYLPEQYHDLLPKLREDNKVYPTIIRLLTNRLMTRPEYTEAHHTGGYRGLYDPNIRVAEMDREILHGVSPGDRGRPPGRPPGPPRAVGTCRARLPGPPPGDSTSPPPQGPTENTELFRQRCQARGPGREGRPLQ